MVDPSPRGQVWLVDKEVHESQPVLKEKTPGLGSTNLINDVVPDPSVSENLSNA